MATVWFGFLPMFVPLSFPPMPTPPLSHFHPDPPSETPNLWPDDEDEEDVCWLSLADAALDTRGALGARKAREI